MHNNNTISFKIIFFLMIAWAPSLLIAQPYEYAVFRVPGLGDYSTSAWDVNSQGNVVGLSYPQGEGEYHAFISDCRVSVDLGTLGGDISKALSINQRNTVVGFASDSSFNSRAFTWQLGTGMIDLGTFGGDVSKANSINSLGQVTGHANYFGDQTGEAFIWENGEKISLGSLDNTKRSIGYDINSNGVVVGQSDNANGVVRPVMWKDGQIIDLGSLGDGMNRGEARGINDFDQVVGQSWDEKDNRPFIWDNGNMFSLSNKQGYAREINNQGQVVGAVFNGSKGFGFIWDQVNGLRHLEDLLPANCGIRITDARDISENGLIAVAGPDPDSCHFCFRSYMLSPVDPEMVLSDPVPGVAGVVNSWTVTGAVPGAKVTFVYGFKGGGTFVPGCDKLDAVLQMDDTKIIKTVTADGNGVATVDVFVPGVANTFNDILVQAVSLDVCQESQLTVVNFQ